jgi:hypothetical protein
MAIDLTTQHFSFIYKYKDVKKKHALCSLCFVSFPPNLLVLPAKSPRRAPPSLPFPANK